MAPQTTMAAPSAYGPNGTVINNISSRSGVNAEVSAEIAMGLMVAYSADGKFVEPAAVADVLSGILLFSHYYDQQGGELGTTGLKPGAVGTILTRGSVVVTSEDAVTPSSEVHVRIGGTGSKGAFRGTADGINTVDISAFARWETSAGIGGKAVLAIDMTGAAAAIAY